MTEHSDVIAVPIGGWSFSEIPMRFSYLYICGTNQPISAEEFPDRFKLSRYSGIRDVIWALLMFKIDPQVLWGLSLSNLGALFKEKNKIMNTKLG